MHDETSYPASDWRSRSCRTAVRVNSGRMASRFVSRPQWAIMRSGVTITGSSAVGAFCWESGEVMELLVSVSLWPVININEQLQSSQVVQIVFFIHTFKVKTTIFHFTEEIFQIQEMF